MCKRQAASWEGVQRERQGGTRPSAKENMKPGQDRSEKKQDRTWAGQQRDMQNIILPENCSKGKMETCRDRSSKRTRGKRSDRLDRQESIRRTKLSVRIKLSVRRRLSVRGKLSVRRKLPVGNVLGVGRLLQDLERVSLRGLRRLGVGVYGARFRAWSLGYMV